MADPVRRMKKRKRDAKRNGQVRAAAPMRAAIHVSMPSA